MISQYFDRYITMKAKICRKAWDKEFTYDKMGPKFMIKLRLAKSADMEDFYVIAHATGNVGADASHIYGDQKILGHVYAAPYLTLMPDLCFVAEDEKGVAGYVVGAPDSAGFEALMEKHWWPDLRAAYEAPDIEKKDSWSAEKGLIDRIFHPSHLYSELAEAYPAHVHLNLLPRIQGQGIGPKLFDLWWKTARELGVKKCHVGVSPKNEGAVKFWKKCGFSSLEGKVDLPPVRTLWLGQDA